MSVLARLQPCRHGIPGESKGRTSSLGRGWGGRAFIARREKENHVAGFDMP